MIEDAKTSHPAQPTLGMNSNTSTRKERRVKRKVGMVRMNKPRRYRAECAGE